MNKRLPKAATRSRHLTECASARWSKSKHFVVRRSWLCDALSLVAIAATVLLALGKPAAAQGCVGTLGPCFQALGFLDPLTPSASSFATAISPDGSVVVGGSVDSSGANEGFRWTAGTMSGLGFPGCASNCQAGASGVNQQGIISGFVGSGAPSLAYSWTNGVGTPLGLLPGVTTSIANAIAAQANVVVGTGQSNVAIVWRNGLATALLPLSMFPSSGGDGVSGNGQVVVGISSDPQCAFCARAVMWEGTTVSPLGYLGEFDTFSAALAANADGSVILGYSGGQFPPSITPVRWVNGAPLSLGDLDPYAIDATGLVVAGGSPSNAVPGAIRWTSADGEQSIQMLLTAAGVDTTGWIFQRATVNGNGRVFAGYGTDPNGNNQAFIARLPLPAALVTMHTHDFSGEGKSDLLWQGSTGFGATTFPVAVWTMNGAQIVQSGGVGALPSMWRSSASEISTAMDTPIFSRVIPAAIFQYGS
jgi:probable HAF family extracellular repeat protein